MFIIILNIQLIIKFFPHRNIFGPVLGSSPAQNPPVLPSMQPGFGGNLYKSSFGTKKDIFWSTRRLKATPVFYLAVPSTNPFVAAAVAPEMATNPFQTNGRAPAAGMCEL